MKGNVFAMHHNQCRVDGILVIEGRLLTRSWNNTQPWFFDSVFVSV